MKKCIECGSKKNLHRRIRTIKENRKKVYVTRCNKCEYWNQCCNDIWERLNNIVLGKGS